MKRLLLLGAAVPFLTAAYLPSTPDLGKAEAQCRANETGPAFMVDVTGLKNRTGRIKVEVYPANDQDFLADDNVLIMAGKTFRRAEAAAPASGDARFCLRLPGPGRYAVSVLHDTDSNRKFNWTHDGIGFSANPKLGWSKPKAASVAVNAGAGLTPLRIVMNYRNGLMSVGPVKAAR
jgi:uncharacterized protein (DUF2141 family)